MPPSKNIPGSLSTGRRIIAIIGGSIGNLIEWYDWFTYSAFALYFSPAFFPGHNQTVQLLGTAGIFAVGFIMRPVGGWLFGVYADKKGRKISMILSVLMMSIGSLMVTFMPTYHTIGIAAPVLLLLARMIQGFSLGGEYGTAVTYLSEMALKGRRGFYASFHYSTLIGGMVLALAIQLVLQNIGLSHQQLENWGWRIPFFIGAVLAVGGLYLRSNLDETSSFQLDKVKQSSRGSIINLFKHHSNAAFKVVGISLGGNLAFYTYTNYMQKFLVNTSHLTLENSTLISFVSLFIIALLQPVFGSLSDKLGRKPLLICFGVLGTLFTIPLMTALSHTHSLLSIFALMMAGLLILLPYTSVEAIVKAELFPSEIRALGVGFPYSITVALFGGTAEYIALWFKKTGHESYYYWYVSAGIFISLLVYITMKDTRKTSLMREE